MSAPLLIVICKGADGRYSYMPARYVPILRPEYDTGEFDTEQQALDAARADCTIPRPATFQLQFSTLTEYTR